MITVGKGYFHCLFGPFDVFSFVLFNFVIAVFSCSSHAEDSMMIICTKSSLLLSFLLYLHLSFSAAVAFRQSPVLHSRRSLGDGDDRLTPLTESGSESSGKRAQTNFWTVRPKPVSPEALNHLRKLSERKHEAQQRNSLHRQWERTYDKHERDPLIHETMKDFKDRFPAGKTPTYSDYRYAQNIRYRRPEKGESAALNVFKSRSMMTWMRQHHPMEFAAHRAQYERSQDYLQDLRDRRTKLVGTRTKFLLAAHG